LSFCCGYPGIFVRQIEMLGVGILKSRFIAWLPPNIEKKRFYWVRVACNVSLDELLAGLLALLFGKIFLEGDGLLEMKGFEISILGVCFETTQGLCGCSNCWFAVPAWLPLNMYDMWLRGHALHPAPTNCRLFSLFSSQRIQFGLSEPVTGQWRGNFSNPRRHNTVFCGNLKT